MLNLFPTLLSFGFFAPMFLRIVLGIIFVYISYNVVYKNKKDFLKYYKNNKYPLPEMMVWFLGVITAVCGVFFIIGFLVQVVSLIAIYILISISLSDKEISRFNFTVAFYWLAIFVSLSLLFSGAGAFAIDLPL